MGKEIEKQETMTTYPINQEAHERLILSLRNHRLVILTVMFILAFPSTYYSSTSIYLYVGVWFFYMAAIYLSTNPKRTAQRIASISLSNDNLQVNQEKKEREIDVRKIRLIVNKKYGIFIFTGILKGAWIPKSVENLDPFLDHLQKNVSNKVYSRTRNPIYYLLILMLIVYAPQFGENLIPSLLSMLAGFVFWLFME